MPDYDVIVLGTGAIGSAALFHLARRGVKALGIDRFPIAHDRGSSHGQTRIIRQAYFEHADYVPLLLRAYQLWSDLEARCGQKLFHQVGLLQVGSPHGRVLSGVLNSAAKHHLAVEHLDAGEIERRWPALRVADPNLRGAFERKAGFLEVENCVRACADEARKLGAQLAIGEPVQTWTARDNIVKVHTASATFTAKRLLIAAGAWAGQVLTDIGCPLRVLRKSLFWFQPPTEAYLPDRFPCFIFELPEGEFYGFPEVAPLGVKVAEHTGGQLVSDPLNVSRELDPNDLHRVSEFASSHLPTLGPRLTQHAVCMYTMSPDKHFLVDRHPRHDNVFFVAGLSGHGFKFAGVLGQALADLAVDDATDLPIGFLSARRFVAT